MNEYSNTRAHETRTRVNFTQSTNFRVYNIYLHCFREFTNFINLKKFVDIVKCRDIIKSSNHA